MIISQPLSPLYTYLYAHYLVKGLERHQQAHSATSDRWVKAQCLHLSGGEGAKVFEDFGVLNLRGYVIIS